jgi:hypothetical protein
MRLFPLVLSLTFAGTAAFAIEACSDSSSTDGTADTDGGGASETGTKPSTGTDASGGDDDAATATDSGTTKDSGCAPVAPSLDAGGGCGTMEFGAVAAPFTGVDAGDGGDYVGGAFPAGIYDAVGAERASGASGSWRETFVSDGNGRFTRIRQIDTGSGGGVGPVTRRSGMYTVSGKDITFTYDCAQSNDVAIATPGSDTLPYEILTDSCAATYRYGATGIRISLKRR